MPVRSSDPLRITLNRPSGLSGTAEAGASIEVINRSAPGTADTFVLTRADAQGRFRAEHLDGVREGDVLQVRARSADGRVTDWVEVRANTAERKDTRPAALRTTGLSVRVKGDGKVSLEQRDATPVSEPGARLQLTNLRTRDVREVTLDGNGRLPKALALPGRAGDVFSVAASDGANNVDFTLTAGHVDAPGGRKTDERIADPAMHRDEIRSNGKPAYETARFTGPLFVKGAKPADVVQGSLANCYFSAAAAALAKAAPRQLEQLIREVGDGTYAVTFHERDWATGQVQTVEVRVDADLYVRGSTGLPYYGSAPGEDAKSLELWYPLLEKAYATWKGSYDAVGNGGVASEVLEAFTGSTGRYETITASTRPDALWTLISTALDEKRPVVAGTHAGEARYTNTGVYGDHAYSVLGAETRDGKRYVVLRNPWGDSEPAGNGADDGVFRLELSEFKRLFADVMTTEG